MHLIPVFLVVIASMHLKHLHTLSAFYLEEDKVKRNRLLFHVFNVGIHPVANFYLINRDTSTASSKEESLVVSDM